MNPSEFYDGAEEGVTSTVVKPIIAVILLQQPEPIGTLTGQNLSKLQSNHGNDGI